MNTYFVVGTLLVLVGLLVVGPLTWTPWLALRARWKHKMETEDIVKIVAACKAPLNVTLTTDAEPPKPPLRQRLVALVKRLRPAKRPRDG